MPVFTSRLALVSLFCAVPAAFAAQIPTINVPLPAAPLFSDAERARIVTYWNAPGRYEIGPRPEARQNGLYIVRLTPEASKWFWSFNRYLKPGGLAPTKNSVDITDASRPWENWVAAKLKYDRAVAAKQAALANAQLFGTNLAPDVPVDITAPVTPTNRVVAAPGATLTPLAPAPMVAAPALAAPALAAPAALATPALEPLPPHPGPMPADLLAAIGNAPPFAGIEAPRRYTIRFETGETIAYTDHLAPSAPRNAYLRFGQGVASGGRALSSLPPAELDAIFAASDLSPVEGRVMRAISMMEGGFDSINTYDTGFLSVGFIQFAALEAGGGSLGDVLKFEKASNPRDYARDFHDLGVDVTPAGLLAVIDPSSGAQLVGNEAVLKIIDDKRLTAVFHLAGQRSTTFRAAQIHVAKTNYYPADVPVSVTLNGQTLTARAGDIIHSEAGLATLFDRKVNTGNIRVLGSVLQELMLRRGLSDFAQVAPFEREIIAGVRWRADFLQNKNLSQPQ